MIECQIGYWMSLPSRIESETTDFSRIQQMGVANITNPPLPSLPPWIRFVGVSVVLREVVW